jgi:hypothetical protein
VSSWLCVSSYGSGNLFAPVHANGAWQGIFFFVRKEEDEEEEEQEERREE